MSPDDLVFTLHSGIQALGDRIKEQDRNFEILIQERDGARLRIEKLERELALQTHRLFRSSRESDS